MEVELKKCLVSEIASVTLFEQNVPFNESSLAVEVAPAGLSGGLGKAIFGEPSAGRDLSDQA